MRAPLIFRIFKNNQLVGVKQFDQDQIVIGHNAEVHLDLDSDQVSPIHCLIELRDNGYYVCDLGSSTGTFKNGQAVLDEAVASGDEIEIGPFKIAFFVGVPKPKVAPGATVSTQAVMPSIPEVKPASAPMPPAAVVKTEEIKVTPVIPVEPPKVEDKPVITTAPVRPEIRKDKVSYKKAKKTKTFAPPSEIADLKTHLKPGKGTTVEVIVAWKERVLTTYHFKGNKTIRVNAGGDNQVALPDGLVPRGYPLIEMAGGLKVNTTSEMNVQLVSSAGTQPVEDLARNGKATRGGQGHSVRVEQNEMLCVDLPGGNIHLYIRFVPQAPVVPMLPPLMLSGSEMTGVVMSIVMVALLALYISATIPKDWQENKQEEVQRIAQVVFNNPPPKPTPSPTPTPPTPPPPPPAVQPTPTPTPQKVVVADETKEAQKKGPAAPKAARNQVAARASEVAPKPNAKDRTKKFTSTRQGGAIKTGQTAGANAQSSNKDLSKVGLFSAFGGGGSRANIDKAYSGAGEVLGMADKATGSSGFNEDRAGEDLGSKFKDAGAGGKGTATQGIAGIGTKGRGSGQAAYGASEGFGSKTTVAIEGGGMGESFDGTIDKEAIRRVIRAKLHEVKSCYERVLNTMEKGRKLEGKVVLGWEIIERGQARNVKVKSSTLGNAQVENCIRDRLASWTFPEPPPGLVAEVQAYPFLLNQAN
ncbi:AgmX/PglI C-terminal domain-containing protein [Bdellovibrio sp. 22V]|uniref:AgmX/PglI C-terminal domain-containing protein n=1 Tax=Bdellovibrio TaxID=958 RepID=UPI0025432DE3|nr:AgmX/PglI C-terminal domain-containing protein [Bdellovibrio sp. 22V]WII73451.1 AgmX/PglI C-terminal domain-containing protein [Bdellovibrio sp. 22V]